ncbi:MAG: sensor histidine kinase [Candidatus Binatia bacterium]
MSASVYHRLRLATFAFLALIIVGLVITTALSIREQRRLRAAQSELARVRDFERMHIVVSQRVGQLGENPADDPPGRQAADQQLQVLIALSVDQRTVEKLDAVRVRLELIDSGGAVHFARGVALLNEAASTERERQAEMLQELESEVESQQLIELAAPLAILALGVLLLPLARRRIIKPLDAFGRRLASLAEGSLAPAPPLEQVEPFVLPLHRQLNAVAARLHELEAAHMARAESLEAEVRATTRQLLDQQRTLARAERLAATGELAASLAHELRNPLAGIQMTLANLRAEIRDPELGERLERVSEEVARLTRLLNSLLDVARERPEPAQPIRLAALVDDLLALTRCQLPATVRLQNTIDPALTWRLPPDHLRQALLNLLLNAGAALANDGGSVTIAAHANDAALEIVVSDNGPGFPSELLANGIRPFFSTRERGTGLGLAMVRRFVRDLGGELDIENVSPHGARVRMVLRNT